MEDEVIKKAQDLKKNQKLVATYEIKERNEGPPYITVGNGRTNKEFPGSVTIDTFRILSELTKEQISLVADLKDILVEQQVANYYSGRTVQNPNLVTLQRKGNNDVHDSIAKRMSEHKNCTELARKGVLVRAGKRRQYMLNPYMFIPFKDFKQVAELWEGYLSH